MFFLFFQVDNSVSDGHLLQLRLYISASYFLCYALPVDICFSSDQRFFWSFQAFNFFSLAFVQSCCSMSMSVNYQFVRQCFGHILFL